MQELWVIDAEARRTFVHRQPSGGKWGFTATREAAEEMTFAAIPEFRIRLAEV